MSELYGWLYLQAKVSIWCFLHNTFDNLHWTYAPAFGNQDEILRRSNSRKLQK